MKPILLPILLCVALFASCTKQQIEQNLTDPAIVTAVTVATNLGLKQLKSPNQQVVANYLNTYAGSLRTITGTPTPEQLTATLQAFIPANIQTQYPELVSFAIPLIVSNYKALLDKYGSANQKQVYQYLNDIATGIETGSACCLH